MEDEQKTVEKTTSRVNSSSGVPQQSRLPTRVPTQPMKCEQSKLPVRTGLPASAGTKDVRSPQTSKGRFELHATASGIPRASSNLAQRRAQKDVDKVKVDSIFKILTTAIHKEAQHYTEFGEIDSNIALNLNLNNESSQESTDQLRLLDSDSEGGIIAVSECTLLENNENNVNEQNESYIAILDSCTRDISQPNFVPPIPPVSPALEVERFLEDLKSFIATKTEEIEVWKESFAKSAYVRVEFPSVDIPLVDLSPLANKEMSDSFDNVASKMDFQFPPFTTTSDSTRVNPLDDAQRTIAQISESFNEACTKKIRDLQEHGEETVEMGSTWCSSWLGLAKNKMSMDWDYPIQDIIDAAATTRAETLTPKTIFVDDDTYSDLELSIEAPLSLNSVPTDDNIPSSILDYDDDAQELTAVASFDVVEAVPVREQCSKLELNTGEASLDLTSEPTNDNTHESIFDYDDTELLASVVSFDVVESNEISEPYSELELEPILVLPLPILVSATERPVPSDDDISASIFDCDYGSEELGNNYLLMEPRQENVGCSTEGHEENEQSVFQTQEEDFEADVKPLLYYAYCKSLRALGIESESEESVVENTGLSDEGEDISFLCEVMERGLTDVASGLLELQTQLSASAENLTSTESQTELSASTENLTTTESQTGEVNECNPAQESQIQEEPITTQPLSEETDLDLQSCHDSQTSREEDEENHTCDCESIASEADSKLSAQAVPSYHSEILSHDVKSLSDASEPNDPIYNEISHKSNSATVLNSMTLFCIQEVSDKILENMYYEELLVMRRVCSQWRDDVTNSTEFWKQLKVKKQMDHLVSWEELSSSDLMRFNCPNIHIQRCELRDKGAVSFLEERSSSLKHLGLEYCEFGLSTLHRILYDFVFLQHLEIIGFPAEVLFCEALFPTGSKRGLLPHLNTLILNIESEIEILQSGMTEGFLVDLLSVTKRLKFVKLVGFNSRSIKTFLEYVNNRGKHRITELYLSKIPSDAFFVEDFLPLALPSGRYQLRELEISLTQPQRRIPIGITPADRIFGQIIGNHSTTLEYICLDNCPITEATLNWSMPNMFYVSVAGTNVRLITEFVWNMPNLRRLPQPYQSDPIQLFGFGNEVETTQPAMASPYLFALAAVLTFLCIFKVTPQFAGVSAFLLAMIFLFSLNLEY